MRLRNSDVVVASIRQADSVAIRGRLAHAPRGRRICRRASKIRTGQAALANLLMIAHYEHLVEIDGMRWGLDTAIAGAADRLTPILMTSIVTGLGVLPLAIGMGDPSREIEGPMAIVILGGLLTSMALNLLVLPTLALRYGRFEAVTNELAAEPPGAVRVADD